MTLSSRRPEPSFLQWLVRNPTGIPRSEALLRALAGTGSAGLLSFVIVCSRRAAPTPHATRTFGAAAAGGALAPLCVTAATLFWTARCYAATSCSASPA